MIAQPENTQKSKAGKWVAISIGVLLFILSAAVIILAVLFFLKVTTPEPNTLEGCIATYPEYTGGLKVKAKVQVTYSGTSVNFKYDIKNGDSGCEDCGIHIHTGLSCNNNNLVGGHFWNPVTEDVWTKKYGATYKTDNSGNGSGEFTVDAGYSRSINVGRAVVIHGKDGKRYGCGLLGSESVSNCF